MSTGRFDKSKKPYSRPNRPRRSEGDWVHDKAPGSNIAKTPRVQADTPNVAKGNSNLLVSNLHYEITPKDLTQIFGQVGTLIREPLIRYDRSGRSSGVAVIFFETAADAKKALEQYDQKLCRGQPMSITFDHGPPVRQARRVTSAPSLINRIQKPPLAERLGAADTKSAVAPAQSNGTGPIRNKGRGAPRAPREPKKPRNTPKTAEDLDKELDAFMKDDSMPATAPPAQSAPAAQTADVEMAA